MSKRILIIEDEPPAIARLKSLLSKLDDEIDIIDAIDSVESAIGFLKNFDKLDLIFMDIQLSDGLSFEIFNEVDLKVPIIFTTAFDQYMMNAFKVHSVDYLLKPIEPLELENAYEKFNRYYAQGVEHQTPVFRELIDKLTAPKYKERFLVKSKSELRYINIGDIAYFFSDGGYTHIMNHNNHKFIVDYKMDELDQLLNPSDFFRASRKFICNIHCIQKIEPYFNSRLKLKVTPDFPGDVIVSRDRCQDFKSWLDR